MKLKKVIYIIPLLISSCGPSICDCINAEKKDDGSYKNYELGENCNELLNQYKEKLINLSPEEREIEIKAFEDIRNECK